MSGGVDENADVRAGENSEERVYAKEGQAKGQVNNESSNRGVPDFN